MNPQTPPHSTEDEAMILGCMMIEKEATETGIEALVCADFYEPRNARIFEIITDLYSRNIAVDIGSVAAELRRKKALEEIGGGEYLASIIDGVTTAYHAKYYSENVKDCSILRSLISSFTEIIGDCYERDTPAKEILEKAEKHVYAITEKGVTSQLVPMSQFVHESIEGVEAVFKKQEKTTGLETGFPMLDKVTSGLQPGNMVVLAARPGMGKTSLAMDIARHAAIDKGLPVAFFSLEMTRTEMVMRLLSAMTGISLYNIRTGSFNSSKWMDITQASSKLAESPLYLDCSSFNMSAIGIRSSARRLAGKMVREGKKLGLIVVDYLQLISSRGGRHENRQSEVAEISRSLKAISMDLNVPVLALSQLNRQTEEAGRGGRPRLSDLRESGAIEQDSDLVMFIFREALYKAGATDEEKSKTKLIIAKHRNGTLAELDFHFAKEITRFYETEKQA